jgi:cell division initiation protein
VKISPLDIRKQMFRKGLRGYDEHEVNAFLERVANEVEDLLQESRGLRDQVGSLETQVANYRKIEEALRNALVTAEKVARETKMNADQEVALTLKDAQVRAQRSVEAAREILGSVQRDLLEMAKQRRDYLTRFRLLVETQMKMLDIKQVEFEDEENLRRLEEIQRELFEDSFDRDRESGHQDTEEMRLAETPHPPSHGEEAVAPKLEARTSENA